MIKRIITIMTGAVGAQLIGFIAAPIITRLYSPEQFGFMTAFFALTMVLGSIAALRYEFAIVLPKNKQRRNDLLNVSLLLNLFFCFLIFLIFLGLKEGVDLAQSYSYISNKNAVFVCVSVFLLSSYNSYIKLLLSMRKVKQVAFLKVFQVVSLVASQILLYKYEEEGLILGIILSYLFVLLIAIYVKPVNAKNKISFVYYLVLIRRYRNFPKFDVMYSLSFNLGQRLPVLVFGGMFGLGVAGVYGLAHRVLAMPMSLIGKSIGSVFLADAAGKHRDNSLSENTHKVNLLCLSLISTPMVILFFFSEYVFNFVFGEEWSQAGVIAKYLTPWIFFQFISAPISSIYFVLNKQKISTLIQISMSIFRLVALALCYIYKVNLVNTIIYFSIVSSFFYLLNILYAYKLLRLNIFSLIFPSIRSFLPSLFFVYMIGFLQDESYMAIVFYIILLSLEYIIRLKGRITCLPK